MLIVTRKEGESIRIGEGPQAVVVRLLKTGSRVSVGIEAPRETPVVRAELVREGNTSERSAA